MTQTLQVRNPRTGQVDASLEIPTTSELDELADRLRLGQAAWAERGASARAVALAAWADRLSTAGPAISDALFADTGRQRESAIEVQAVAGLLRRWAASAPDLLRDPAPRDASVPGFEVQQGFDPYALVGVISPWNFPLLLSLIDAVPALAAGSAVVVKPSEVTPRFVAAVRPTLGELADVLGFVVGDGSTGAGIIDRVDFVCFTGSVATGRRVAEQAARRFIPASLELGGKDPAVVLPGADLAHAARGILWGATSNAGQACQSIERVYVHRDDHDDLVRHLVEGACDLALAHPDPTIGEIGPIIAATQADVLRRHLDDATARGAKALTGGEVQELGGGLWLEPTVLVGVDHDMLVMREETFGPIIPIMAYDDEDEAVALANDTTFGLSAAVFGRKDDAIRVGRRLHVGAVSINDAALTAMVYDAEKQSFGLSGMGASRMGAAALTRFGRRRAHLVNTHATPDPWWWPEADPSGPDMTIQHRGAPLNIANGIREFAIASPDRAAVVDGDRTLTYRQLDDRSSRLANALVGSGLQRGAHVAVLLGNRLEYCEVACGIAKAGMTMVPINPRLTAPEVTYIVEHSHAVALILDDALAPVAHEAATKTGFMAVLSIEGTAVDGAADYEAALAAAASEDPRMVVSETEPFCIAYTSGTTGKPKGVMISHRSRSLTFYATALEWNLGPGKRTIAVAPMYHGAGFAFAYGAVHTGGTVAMLRSWDPKAFLSLVAEFRPNSVFLVPAHAQMLRSLGEDAIRGFDTSALETVYFNAAPLPQELKLWFMDTFPEVETHELYGSTEAGIVTNLRHADMRRKVACVGPPWFMTEVRLQDEDGHVIEGAGRGELFSRSPYLMNGYLNDPAATEACTTTDGFLSSGDIAERDDEGHLYIVDRTKDLIISGGVNVYPREVEEVLATHASVRECAVVGLPDEKWGESVTACIVPTGDGIDVDALEAHCRENLAGFKVPRRWEAVDALPRNAAMKVLKTDLRARFS